MTLTEKQLVVALKAIADPTRLKILGLLKQTGCCSIGRGTGLCACDIDGILIGDGFSPGPGAARRAFDVTRRFPPIVVGDRRWKVTLGPLVAEYEVRRRQALETRFGVTTVLRAGPPARALPLPTRGSVDGPHARALASRPERHGVLAEIDTAPPRADCSSRGGQGLPRGAFGGVVTRVQLRVGSRGPG